ncbi:hypothetical protein J6590_067943 [Homalodisca vitripennis]|nr:hypothetical protein J6590_067943 [Homalodisca vitripennis]
MFLQTELAMEKSQNTVNNYFNCYDQYRGCLQMYDTVSCRRRIDATKQHRSGCLGGLHVQPSSIACLVK